MEHQYQPQKFDPKHQARAVGPFENKFSFRDEALLAIAPVVISKFMDLLQSASEDEIEQNKDDITRAMLTIIDDYANKLEGLRKD